MNYILGKTLGSFLMCTLFFRYLVCFLAKLAEHSEENKMSASNIAIVIGPNVLWDANDGG